MTRIDPKRLPGLCREHAKGYGALRPNSLTAIALDAAADRIEALEAALVAEREENLWNAYYTGHVKGDVWTHMFMSDGEWLATECGFDPRKGHYPDAEIRAAIPLAARAALGGEG